ncbi:MAG: aldehyde dehydrogenase family protein [Rickettsiales bacterium]
MSFISVNPFSGEVVERYEADDAVAVERKLEKLENGFRARRRASVKSKAHALRRMADLLERDVDRFSLTVTRETGKLLAESRAEIHKCADLCRYYADHAEELLEDRVITSHGMRARAALRPVGAILAVMPWNFPFWQVFRCLAPAVLLGNVVALKHAPNVQGCAAEIEGLADEASPEGCVLQNFRISPEETHRLIADSRIAAVTLTGSERAGRAVAKTAGEHLKKTVLELGGSDAYVVLEDADVALAASSCVQSRMLNAGQSCVAAKRFIAHEAVYDAFVGAVLEKMRAYRVADPQNAGTTLAPLVSATAAKRLHKIVTESLADGARLLLGGDYAEDGAAYPATVLACDDSIPACCAEETFGPVASILKAKDEGNAVRLANASRFGLGGAVFSRDLDRARRFAADLYEAGGCAINDFFRSDAAFPFGGIKSSGYGRELACEGVREFANVKTILGA